MESSASESELIEEALKSPNLQLTLSNLESRGNVAKEPSSPLHLRSHIRKLMRMHPYADEKMRIQELVTRVCGTMQEKNQELQKEVTTLQHTIKSYEEQINWQEEHIKVLEDGSKSKDERIKSLEDQVKSVKVLEDSIKSKDERIESLEELVKSEIKEEKIDDSDKIKEYEERIKIQIETDAAKEQSRDESANQIKSRDELIKSQEDRIQQLEEELRDLTDRVKKQEMQIQFIEMDLKYKDTAASAYVENTKRLQVQIQFLEVELNYRTIQEDTLKQDREKLKNENLSLSNILKDMKTSDGCSSSEDFCCETVKQVKLSFIDLIETEFECVICNGMFIEATITTCNHMFCNYCIHMWRKKSSNCPICRSFITYEIKTTVIDNFIMNTANLISEKMLNDRKKILEERKQAKTISKYKRLCV